MANTPRVFRLPGPSQTLQSAPQTCPVCGAKHFYKQADFNRGLGLWLVGIASVMTVALNYFGFNWFVQWSPMVAFLFFDRIFAYLSPTAVICYMCETVFRGLPEATAAEYEDFDLDRHDRIKYPERMSENS